MARLDRLVPRVNGFIHGAPHFVVEDALTDSAGDLCRQSGAWREQLDPVELKAGEGVYDLEPPFGAEVAVLLKALQDGRSLQQSNTGALLGCSLSGMPTHIAMEGAQQIRVCPVPAGPGEIHIYAALAPAHAEVPDWLVSRYQDALIYGAVWRLMEQPGNTWSSVEASRYYRQRFDEEVARAKREAITSFGAPQQVRNQPFGG